MQIRVRPWRDASLKTAFCIQLCHLLAVHPWANSVGEMGKTQWAFELEGCGGEQGCRGGKGKHCTLLFQRAGFNLSSSPLFFTYSL